MQSNVQTLLGAVEKQDVIIRELLDRVARLENQGAVYEAKAEAAASREVGRITRELSREFDIAIAGLRSEIKGALPPPKNSE